MKRQMSRPGLVGSAGRFASVREQPSANVQTKLVYSIWRDVRYEHKTVLAVDRDAMSRLRGCDGLHGGRLYGAVVIQPVHDDFARRIGGREQPMRGLIHFYKSGVLARRPRGSVNVVQLSGGSVDAIAGQRAGATMRCV